MACDLQPLAQDGISVIVPVHGEFAGLPRFRDAWEAQLIRMDRPFEFHVVEDQSLGAALRTGLASSTQPLVLFIVPDYAYRPGDLRALIEAINEAQMVLGVRQGVMLPRWLARTLQIRRWICRIVFGIDEGELPKWYGLKAWKTQWWRRIRFGLRAQDAECGLRLVRRDLLNRCPIQSEGTFALVEMIAKINFAGGSMIEVPLSKPGDLPIMAPFPSCPGDESSVFRNPIFRPLGEVETKKPEEISPSGQLMVD
jgi:hypothetical protein